MTDFTRFKNGQRVCIAGTDIVTGQCVRPWPYLAPAECERLQILPGTILTGTFNPIPHLTGPHQEDTSHIDLHGDGACTSDQFKWALEAGLFSSIERGFEINLAVDQKHIPLDHKLGRSIITIRIKPANIELEEDAYSPGRIKLHLTDGSGRNFRYLPITDLGFYRHAMTHQKAGDLESLNSFIYKQEEVYIRIGLSRNWDQRPGYWMQVNGIYTFPNYHREIRSLRIV
ncbi:dual OB domain-containing protein [Nitrosovibrio tenuis]|uniref:dual OB domain-containing protein n=1 Tax=Nitrosovibrio tenuis TaxID=1233 RepID=UPI00115F8EF0|nr:hypothetical protein [Nitrosovibrio tenuis]